MIILLSFEERSSINNVRRSCRSDGLQLYELLSTFGPHKHRLLEMDIGKESAEFYDNDMGLGMLITSEMLANGNGLKALQKTSLFGNRIW